MPGLPHWLAQYQAASPLRCVRVWPIACADGVFCINVIHITPWAATVGLLRGAAAVLPLSGMLYVYGPFRREGRHTAPSNEAFDRGPE